jgi:hypothetical protein
VKSVRDVPTIAWIIAGVLLTILVSIVGVVASRDREQAQRVAAADSTARAHLLEAVILRRDAASAAARADSIERRADSLAALLASAREDITAKLARAAASRAKVDTTDLRPDVAQALAGADSLRIAVAENLPRDSATLAVYQTASAEYAHTIELHVGAYAEQGAALIAREIQIRALEQQHAPRCARTCGVVLGAGGVLVVRELALQLLELLKVRR